jgi:hypothetical protein
MKLLPAVIFITFFLLPFDLSAQIGRGRTLDENPDFPDSLNLQTDSNYVVPDTTILNYFYIDQLNSKIPFSDSLISYPFSQIDYSRWGKVDHLNLGNPGSANTAIRTKINDVHGFDHGLHQYDVYRREKEEFKFYDLNRPFTEVYFSPGSSQQNFLIEASFSRRFSKGVSAVIDYYRINQEGFYNDQKTRHTMFSFGLWYKSKSNKFNSFFTYISNAINEENNGGVSNESLFDDPNYQIRLSIPINLTGASTRHETREFTFNNVLRLNNPKNETEYSVRHEFTYQDGKYKYYDPGTSSSADSIFYDSYLVDDRGLRFFLTDDKIENSFFLYSKWKKFGDVRLGLTYSLHQLNLDAEHDNINNLFANFRSKVQLAKTLDLNIVAYLGLMDYAGDFQLKGNLHLKTKLGNLDVGTNFKRSKPGFIYSKLYVSERLIYENDYTRLLSLDLFATLKFGKTELSVSQLTIDKPIYLGADALPSQLDGTYTSSRFSISQGLKLGILHFDNHLYYQLFSDDLFYLPDYFTKHDIYLKSQLFRKKMLFKMGFDVRLWSSFKGPSYMPITGQFYEQNEKIFDFYPEVDFYFIFKVDTFRAFFRMNNVSSYFYNGVRYQVDKYPQFDSNFRFGINWLMKD